VCPGAALKEGEGEGIGDGCDYVSDASVLPAGPGQKPCNGRKKNIKIDDRKRCMSIIFFPFNEI
jgi:hypothetical protein